MDFVCPVVIIGNTRLIAINGIIFGAKSYIEWLNGHFHTFLFHNILSWRNEKH